MIKDLITQLYPLHRTLASTDTYKALEIVAQQIPFMNTIEHWHKDDQVWTWKVLGCYDVREAYIATEDGAKLIDFQDTPLRLVSYSTPVNKVMDWVELALHLHVAEQENTIPWKYAFYEPKWGFCITQLEHKYLSKFSKFHVVIDSSVGNTGVRVLDCFIPGQTDDELWVMAHIDHPAQANDGLSGVAVMVEIMQRLHGHPISQQLNGQQYGIRFLVTSETIGTIAYASRYEDRLSRCRGGIFIEMAGNDNEISMQGSASETNFGLEDMGLEVIDNKHEKNNFLAFRDGPINDEFVLATCGVPTIAFSRAPYPEYHTSLDTPDIILEDKLQEMTDVVEQAIRMFASNFIPRKKFKGPVFMSGLGLWKQWGQYLDQTDKIITYMDGKKSVYELSQYSNCPYNRTKAFIYDLIQLNLVEII